MDGHAISNDATLSNSDGVDIGWVIRYSRRREKLIAGQQGATQGNEGNNGYTRTADDCSVSNG